MRLNSLTDLATDATAAYLTGGASLIPTGGGGSGGANPAGETATATAISPNFQQSFTPQVSPVIQVSQGGGSQSGSTTQKVMSRQQAEGGSAGAGTGSGATPYNEALDLSPGFFDSPEPGQFFDSQGMTDERYYRESGGANYAQYLPLMLGVGALGLLAYVVTNDKSKK